MSPPDAQFSAQLLLVFLGSGLGGVLRYLFGGWVQRFGKEAHFPIGTLAVNLIGCLLAGLLAGAFAHRWPMREEYRVAVVIGLLGGFTTFSSFGLETYALITTGQPGRAALNIALSAGLGLAAIWLGYRLATAA